MGVIEDYVAAYERQFDYWEGTARTARLLLEAELTRSGIRGIVTSRAKSVDRLLDKLRQRNSEKQYKTFEDIDDDIVDLAGVRVALYFPGQIEEVERLITTNLHVRVIKRFPEAPEPGHTPAARRFSGYAARHFRVHIPETTLPDGQARYATALIEIQVASVLMHAWSEVAHDLDYKPLSGELSPSEYALLDQLNGLVLAGEIALEELQKAGDARLAQAAVPLRDHYELAEFLRSRLSLSPLKPELSDATLGRVDILFGYLAEQGTATAADINPYLDRLEHDFERRPVAEQLADLMLSGNADRYVAFRRAVSRLRHPSARKAPEAVLDLDTTSQLRLARFIQTWSRFEMLLAQALPSGSQRQVRSNLHAAANQNIIDAAQLAELDGIRELRNNVVHRGAFFVPSDRLEQASNYLLGIIGQLENQLGSQS